MAQPSLELTRYSDFLHNSRAALTTRPRRLSAVRWMAKPGPISQPSGYFLHHNWVTLTIWPWRLSQVDSRGIKYKSLFGTVYQDAYSIQSTLDIWKSKIHPSYLYFQVNFLGPVRWLVVLGLTALWDSISVYIGLSPREREKEKRNDRQEKKCPNNPHPHPLQAQ